MGKITASWNFAKAGGKYIKNMSYNELVKAVKKGDVTVSQLQNFYSGIRQTAKSRSRAVSKEAITKEVGSQETPDLPTMREIKHKPTDLMHAIVDAASFVRAKRSTPSGLKYQREVEIKVLGQYGIDFVNETNYGKWREFYKWFSASKYVEFYDSNDEVVQTVFEQGATPAEWAALFDSFNEGREESESDGGELS